MMLRTQNEGHQEQQKYHMHRNLSEKVKNK